MYVCIAKALKMQSHSSLQIYNVLLPATIIMLFRESPEFLPPLNEMCTFHQYLLKSNALTLEMNIIRLYTFKFELKFDNNKSEQESSNFHYSFYI